MKVPIVSYYDNYDPTLNWNWTQKLTDINVITTKVLTDKFISFCVANKHRIFIHFVCNGTGETPLEPNIPNLKKSFFSLKALIDAGFPQKQILVIVKPIIQNDNGIKSVKLMMQLFSKFKELRLRYVRFELLKNYKHDFANQKETIDNYSSIIGTHKNQYKHEYRIANPHIRKRITPEMKQFVANSTQFYREYHKLINDYKAIITVDDELEPIIGTRELKPFGYINNIKNALGLPDKIVKYHKNNKSKPMVLKLNSANPVRCQNRCILCPHRQ